MLISQVAVHEVFANIEIFFATMQKLLLVKQWVSHMVMIIHLKFALTLSNTLGFYCCILQVPVRWFGNSNLVAESVWHIITKMAWFHIFEYKCTDVFDHNTNFIDTSGSMLFSFHNSHILMIDWIQHKLQISSDFYWLLVEKLHQSNTLEL